MTHITISSGPFVAAGTMAGRIGAFNWGATPLGSMQHWSPCLRQAVDWMLDAPQPTLLAWGEPPVLLYNDHCIPLLGDRDPGALGGPCDRFWDADWEFYRPHVEAALAGIPQTCGDGRLRTTGRAGRSEGWFDFAWTPLRDEHGVVRGTYCVAHETTDRVIAERMLREDASRQAVLLALDEALRPLADPWQVMATVARRIGMHLGVAAAGYGEVALDGATVVVDGGYDDGRLPGVAGCQRLAALGRDVDAALRAGDTVFVENAAQADGLGAFVIVPVHEGGRLVAAFHAMHPTPRAWSAGERQLLRDVASRTRAEVARARAQAALQASEAQYRALFDSMDEGYLIADVQLDERGHAVDIAYVAANPAAIRLMGGDPGGRRLSELNPACEPHWFEVWERVARTGRGERLQRHAVAEGRWYDFYLFKLAPDDAASRRVAVIFQDISDAHDAARRLQESEERFRALVGGSTLAVWETDADGRVVVDSPSWRALTGQSIEQYFAGGWLGAVHPDDREAVEREWREARALGRNLDVEFRLRQAGGEWRWTNARATPLPDPAGRIRKWIGMNLDIAARKQAEQELREDDERQAFLLQLSDALRDAGDAAGIQARACRMLGEHLGVDRVVYADIEAGHARVRAAWLRGVPAMPERFPVCDLGGALAANGAPGEPIAVDDVAADPRFSPQELETFRAAQVAAFCGVLLTSDGQWVGAFGLHSATPRAWTANEGRLLREVAGRIRAASERARAESALLASEKRLAAIFSNASVGLSEVSADGRFLRVNEELCRIAGRPRAELLELSVRDVTHPDDLLATQQLIDRVLLESRTLGLDKRYLRPDGSITWANISVAPLRDDGGGTHLLAVTVDLSARKAAEQAREASEHLLRQFSEASSDLLWIRDARTLEWEYLSPSFEAIYGSPRSEALLARDVASWTGFVLPEDREHGLEQLRRVCAGERLSFEYRIRRPVDGELRWISNTDFPLYDPDDRVLRIGGISHDVTDLKSTQAALADSERRLRTLTEGIPQLVWRSGEHGQWTWASPQWEAFTGQAPEQSLGIGWLEAVHPDDRARALEAWDVASARGVHDVDLRIRRAADEAWVWHHTRSLPLRDADGGIVEWLGTSTDVQQLKELQSQQEVLVAELQHRTRNLVGVVRSLADRTLDGSSSLEEFRERFRHRMGALARVQGLLSQREAGQRVSFDQLIRTELTGLGALDMDGRGSQVTLEGPRGVRLRSSGVQTFALGLHELATNALKYGALSRPEGRLSVRWAVEDAGARGPRLHVEWIEEGVPVPPEAFERDARRGYGRELIERALPYQLQAETSYRLEPTGVRCSMRVPLAWEDAHAGQGDGRAA